MYSGCQSRPAGNLSDVGHCSQINDLAPVLPAKFSWKNLVSTPVTSYVGVRTPTYSKANIGSCLHSALFLCFDLASNDLSSLLY